MGRGWLFLWAKVTNFVMNRTTALSSVMVETGEGKPPSSVTVKAATFDSEHEFFEALNLFIMWTTALGLGSAICVTSFVQDFVFDTIRVRGASFDVLEAGDMVEGCSIGFRFGFAGSNQ